MTETLTSLVNGIVPLAESPGATGFAKWFSSCRKGGECRQRNRVVRDGALW
jgi:hypothetical protein